MRYPGLKIFVKLFEEESIPINSQTLSYILIGQQCIDAPELLRIRELDSSIFNLLQSRQWQGATVDEENENKGGKNMHKNTRKLITLCTLCILLVSLMVPTAFAGYLSSTATVDFGSTAMAYGGEKALYGVALSGTVKSQTATTSSSVTGYMYTKGSVWTHVRDEESVNNNRSASLYWSNSSGDTGTFWAQCKASSNNHSGYCTVSQST